MKPIYKRIFAAGLAVFVAIQFVRPAKNLGPPPSAADLIVKTAPPPEVARILMVACYDCHSDQTHYPWYAEIEPVGWWLANHVEKGRKRANFSQFGILSPKNQADLLDKAVDTLNHDKMPIWSYRLGHSSARLSQSEKTLLSAWFEQAAEAAMAQPPSPTPKG
jgi:hypothetical protein